MPVIVKNCRTNMFTVLVISAAGKRWLLLRNIAIGSKTCIWIILVATGEQRGFARVLTYCQNNRTYASLHKLTYCQLEYYFLI